MNIITTKQKIINELQNVIDKLDNKELADTEAHFEAIDDLRTVRTWIEERL